MGETTVSGQGHTGQSVDGVELFYIWADHLDTPRVVTNANDDVIWRWESAPFGDADALSDPDGDGLAFDLALRFPGQYFDSETGTHYNYFRDYESGTGRYLQSDPIGIWDDLNTYSYTASQPLLFRDSLGLGKCNSYLQALGLCGRPKLPASRLPSKNIPKGGGIYKMYDCNGQLLYVGKTGNFKTRMKNHRRHDSGVLRAFDKPCCPVRIVFIGLSDMSKIEKVENILIPTYRPPGNYDKNPNPMPYKRPKCKCK